MRGCAALGVTMIARVARRADVLAARLPDTVPDKAETRARIARLASECGCSSGGAFLVAALVVASAYGSTVGEPGVRLVLLSVGFVLVSALVGKLAGVTVAVVRLTAIRRTLSARLARPSADRAQEPTANGT